MWHVWGRKLLPTGFCWEKLEEERTLKDVNVCGE
jgi:hypothetical protein